MEQRQEGWKPEAYLGGMEQSSLPGGQSLCWKRSGRKVAESTQWEVRMKPEMFCCEGFESQDEFMPDVRPGRSFGTVTIG